MPTIAAITEVCKGVGCVLAREAALPQAFVHVSAFAGIAGMLSPNILTLRLLSVLSSSSALSFNLWKRMLSPVFWNLTFITVNLSRIAQLLLASKDSVTLDANEQRLYELGFMRYGVSLRDYATLLREAGGEWRESAGRLEAVHLDDDSGPPGFSLGSGRAFTPESAAQAAPQLQKAPCSHPLASLPNRAGERRKVANPHLA